MPLRILALLICTFPCVAAEIVGSIDFFGTTGMDVAAIEKALPVHIGDAMTAKTRDQIRTAVQKSIGQAPTAVNFVCCDEQHHQQIYIGLPGNNFHALAYNPAPTGTDRLAPAIIRLDRNVDRALETAVRKGGDAASEDDSQGFAIFNDPAAKEAVMAVRNWALDREPEIVKVLESSSDAEQRRVAATALGYVRQSPSQVVALVRAARDPDNEVRNNATRAIGVLLRSNLVAPGGFPPDTFLAMLNSGSWEDRNKSASAMVGLTAGSDPGLLGKLRAECLDSIVEMARWHNIGHAYFARMILARMAGVPDSDLLPSLENPPTDAVIAAVKSRK